MQRPTAHRHLAARVIDQAFRDARDLNGAPTDSASARAFLSGSPMLSYWCEVAELDLNGVIVRARTLMPGYDAGRARGGARTRRAASRTPWRSLPGPHGLGRVTQI